MHSSQTESRTFEISLHSKCWIVLNFLPQVLGHLILISASGGGGLGAFSPGSMSNPPPFPSTWGVGVSIDWCISSTYIFPYKVYKSYTELELPVRERMLIVRRFQSKTTYFLAKKRPSFGSGSLLCRVPEKRIYFDFKVNYGAFSLT